MSQEPKNNEEGFMYKLASFIVDKRNLIFLIVAIGLVFSAFSRNWVQVENQLSAYLPKDSETYKGLHLMEDEFITFGTAKIMLVNVTYDEAQAVSERLEAVDGVQSVTFDDTKEHYTNASALYNITFDYSETDDMCETVMERVEDELSGYDMYVSATFGDTASKTLAQEIGVIVIIVAIVVVSVLILTSQTYAEVPVLLITFIAAALLNMGTNFLLGTISFVSNSVTIVLQLALSVDYAIIFCNRYKEEHEKLPIREAVIVALSKAVPEICGSSLTTIGGLVAMLFMEFRLGFDLGVCLIKSIFFSLFAVFFLMPGLLMLFGKKIDATRHKNFVPKIPFVGRFAYATKKIIPPIFLVVIIVAMLFANNCPYVYGFSYLETTKHSDLKQIAQTTAGFTGADLENLMNEAAIAAARKGHVFICQKDIKNAFIKVGIGAEKKSKVISEKEKRITAYHEAGHAILFHVLPDMEPVYTISIIPTGMGAAGYTMPLPENDEIFNTKGKMLQDITTLLGGRVAEELIFGDITTGASNDIKRATSEARAMVTKYGMSDKIGLISYGDDDDEVFIGRDLAHTRGYSEDVAKAIDSELHSIIEECHDNAKKIISEHMEVLHGCAKLLLEKEKVHRDEFEALFTMEKSGESNESI